MQFAPKSDRPKRRKGQGLQHLRMEPARRAVPIPRFKSRLNPRSCQKVLRENRVAGRADTARVATDASSHDAGLQQSALVLVDQTGPRPLHEFLAHRGRKGTVDQHRLEIYDRTDRQ